jgi:hypothetical protein
MRSRGAEAYLSLTKEVLAHAEKTHGAGPFGSDTRADGAGGSVGGSGGGAFSR